jgi:murein DD-endopeptidase MepM/ murein hydrolase activator NlpD
LAQQISALEQQFHEAASGELDLLRSMKGSQAKLDGLKAKEAVLDTEVADGLAHLDGAQGRLAAQEQRLATAQSGLTVLIGQLDQARTDLRHRAVAAFVGQPAGGAEGDLFDAGLRKDAVIRLTYATSVNDTQAQAVSRFYGLRRQADALAGDLVSYRDKARADRDAVAAQLGVVSAARQRQDALRQVAQSAVQRQAVLLSQLEMQKADFETQITALAAQSDAIAAQLRARQNAAPPPGISGHGLLAVPIPDAPITSPFGPRVDPLFGDVRVHTGVDFGATAGTPIHAAADGVVVTAAMMGGYGNCTIIDHGQALATLYAHQSQLLVNAGDHVVKGQIIGLVGSTGMSTGPHLHFEVRVNGTPVDPIAFL